MDDEAKIMQFSQRIEWNQKERIETGKDWKK